MLCRFDKNEAVTQQCITEIGCLLPRAESGANSLL